MAGQKDQTQPLSSHFQSHFQERVSLLTPQIQPSVYRTQPLIEVSNPVSKQKNAVGFLHRQVLMPVWVMLLLGMVALTGIFDISISSIYAIQVANSYAHPVRAIQPHKKAFQQSVEPRFVAMFLIVSG